MSDSGFTITFNGQDYTLHAMTDRYRNELTKWMRKHAITQTLALREIYPPTEFKAVLDSVNRDIIAGVYDFGGKESERLALSCPEATIYMYKVLFDDIRVSERVVEAMLKDPGTDEQIAIGMKVLHPQLESQSPKDSTPEKSTPS